MNVNFTNLSKLNKINSSDNLINSHRSSKSSLFSHSQSNKLNYRIRSKSIQSKSASIIENLIEELEYSSGNDINLDNFQKVSEEWVQILFDEIDMNQTGYLNTDQVFKWFTCRLTHMNNSYMQQTHSLIKKVIKMYCKGNLVDIQSFFFISNYIVNFYKIYKLFYEINNEFRISLLELKSNKNLLKYIEGNTFEEKMQQMNIDSNKKDYLISYIDYLKYFYKFLNIFVDQKLKIDKNKFTDVKIEKEIESKIEETTNFMYDMIIKPFRNFEYENSGFGSSLLNNSIMEYKMSTKSDMSYAQELLKDGMKSTLFNGMKEKSSKLLKQIDSMNEEIYLLRDKIVSLENLNSNIQEEPYIDRKSEYIKIYNYEYFNHHNYVKYKNKYILRKYNYYYYNKIKSSYNYFNTNNYLNLYNKQAHIYEKFNENLQLNNKIINMNNFEYNYIYQNINKYLSLKKDINSQDKNTMIYDLNHIISKYKERENKILSLIKKFKQNNDSIFKETYSNESNYIRYIFNSINLLNSNLEDMKEQDILTSSFMLETNSSINHTHPVKYYKIESFEYIYSYTQYNNYLNNYSINLKNSNDEYIKYKDHYNKLLRNINSYKYNSRNLKRNIIYRKKIDKSNNDDNKNLDKNEIIDSLSKSTNFICYMFGENKIM